MSVLLLVFALSVRSMPCGASRTRQVCGCELCGANRRCRVGNSHSTDVGNHHDYGTDDSIERSLTANMKIRQIR